MLAASIPEHCTPTTALLTHLSDAFNTCIPTPLAFVSTVLGVLSIVSWLFAQLPQIFKNYTLKSASGLSIYFLAEWLLGDATNLVGALLTKQATWQVVVAGYYVTVDVALMGQFVWYSHVKPWRQKRLGRFDTRRSGGSQDHGGSESVIIEVFPSDGSAESTGPGEGENTGAEAKPREAKFNPFRSSNFSFSPKEKTRAKSSYRAISGSGNSPGYIGPSPRTVVLVSMLFAILTQASPLNTHTVEPPSTAKSDPSTTETVGRIVSWVSTVLYLGSRLPQLYKNFRRQSTAGLSPTLFIAAFFGNLFYSTSLLNNPLAWSSYPPYGLHGGVGSEGSDRWTWVSLAAPFWLGAAGVLGLDAAVGVQFLIYGEEKRVVVVKDERGRSRWRRVSGWMRGWAPSPNPGLACADSEEDQRPLLSRNIDSDGVYGTNRAGVR